MYHVVKKIIFRTSSIALISLLCLCAQAQRPQQSDERIAQDVLIHINKYRTSHHLAPLKMDRRITAVARKHSQDMANHTTPFGHKHFLKRIAQLHAQIKNSGAGAENVAYNYKDGQDVVKNWLTSRGHKRNIDGAYNLTGVGIVHDRAGKIYFTQIFLRT